MKLCSKCKKVLPSSAFYFDASKKLQLSSHCKQCKTKYSKKYWSRNKIDVTYKLNQREKHYKRKYNITIEDYNIMLKEQDNKCAICSSIDTKTTKGIFHVDHCHTTGTIRGLLCFSCNKSLGMLGDNFEGIFNALKYVTRYKDKNGIEDINKAIHYLEMIKEKLL